MVCYVDKLPNEIVHFIYGYLAFRTLIRCRSVCKRWRALVDSFKYARSLAIAPPTLQHWLDTGEPIEPDFIHYFLVESPAESVPFDLTRLRRLIIHALDTDKFEQLSECTPSLTHLEIGSTRLSSNRARLELTKLRVLSLDFSGYTKSGHLSIICPLLKTFSYNCESKAIEISNPESLEHLQFYGTGEFDWKKFRSLKSIAFTSARSVGRDILRLLPSLELLVYGKNARSFLCWFDYWTAGEFVDHLMEEKRRLSKPDLQVVFVETPIAEDARFLDYAFDKLYSYFDF